MKSPVNIAFWFMTLILSYLPAGLSAQLSQGGVPISFSRAMVPDTDIVMVEPPSLESLPAGNEKTALPYPFAVNLPVDLDVKSSGNWHKAPDGTHVWRLNVRSPGALALTLYFDRFNIPETGRLFVYNSRRTRLIGAFTALNNNKMSTFATSLIHGDQLTIEYNAPEGAPPAELHISEIAYAYRGVTDFSGLRTGFGNSGNCQVNVNCHEGDNWQNQKRSVARIQIKRTGMPTVWCTGSLVNNVRNDGTPYILTADHCGIYSTDEDLSQWIFYFNYEGVGCADPSKEPDLQSLTGATRIAHGGNAASSGSDFFLVLLNTHIPDSYHVYFNGWSRETTPPSPSGTGIHHPQGDIKKISTYTKALQPAFWSGGSKLAHWLVNWSETANGYGTTEGGSSGSPLFDPQGRLVGTLTGGESSCDSAHLSREDFYGMFSYSWDKNGTDSTEVLKYWLDPDSTNVMSVNGWALGVPETRPVDQVTLFPNPVDNHLNIKLGTVSGSPVHVTVCDIFGNLRLESGWDTGVGPEMLLDMSGFAPGMYILRISAGDRLIVRKVVKQ